jgi:hypothetical protein
MFLNKFLCAFVWFEGLVIEVTLEQALEVEGSSGQRFGFYVSQPLSFHFSG